MFRIIKKVTNELKDSEMYFTTELKHLDETLENTISVFEFEEDTKKYKVVTKTLDILKPGDNSDKKNEINTDMKFNSNMIVE